jgi:hypothetical protein
MSNPPCDNPAMKKESESQNQVDAAGPSPAPNDPSTLQKITSPSSRSQSTIQFQEIPIGQFFEFRGRRYRKLALSMASDEDRNGDIFQAQTEVLPDPISQIDPTAPPEQPIASHPPSTEGVKMIRYLLGFKDEGDVHAISSAAPSASGAEG